MRFAPVSGKQEILIMAIINKFFIQVHQDGFGWEKFESNSHPIIKDGWLTVHLSNGLRSFRMDKVNQYSVIFELEE